LLAARRVAACNSPQCLDEPDVGYPAFQQMVPAITVIA
jgi:hypothetical protein